MMQNEVKEKKGSSTMNHFWIRACEGTRTPTPLGTRS